MRGSTAFSVLLRRNHTEKLFHCDLSWSSSSSTKELQLIRFDSINSLDFACKLFGITFAIGIRNRRPNRGEKPVSMHHGDVVNFVDVIDLQSSSVAKVLILSMMFMLGF